MIMFKKGERVLINFGTATGKDGIVDKDSEGKPGVIDIMVTVNDGGKGCYACNELIKLPPRNNGEK